MLKNNLAKANEWIDSFFPSAKADGNEMAGFIAVPFMSIAILFMFIAVLLIFIAMTLRLEADEAI
jgi:hypothetical protein